MMSTTTQRPITLNVDPRLLSHEAHLPETVSCSCGYNRYDVPTPKDARR